MDHISQNTCLLELSRKNAQLEIINQINKSISIDMSFDEMMQKTTKKLRNIISYDLLSFCLLENQEKLVITIGVPEDVSFLRKGVVLPERNSAPWKVIKEKYYLIREDIFDIGLKMAEDEILKSIGIRSALIVPLLVKNKAIGTINLGCKKRGMYKESDAQFLQQVADQLAIFIENSRLYAEVKRLMLEWKQSYKTSANLMEEMAKRNTQLEILNSMTRSITVESSLEEILQSITEKLKHIVSYDYITICLLAEQGLMVKKRVPNNGGRFGEGTLLTPVNLVFKQAIEEKKIIIWNDIKTKNIFFKENDLFKNLGINSMIMVPLVIQNKVFGTLNLESFHMMAYSPEHGDFLRQVADHLAICLENSRLYAEESKLKSEWEDTFKAVTDMIYLVTRDYTLLRFNKAVMNYGVAKGEKPEVGQVCYRFINEQGIRCKECPAESVFKSGKTTVKRIYLKNGLIWDLYAYPMFNCDNQVENVICLIKDVTEKIKTEVELIQSAKLAALGEIAAGVAHELNSPLTAIIGNSILLEQEETQTPEDQKELLNDIQNCGIRCKRIINNLRDFVRKDRYQFVLINVNDIVLKALNIISYQIEKGKIQILYELAPYIKTVSGSEQHLEQVLINLILNARDAVENSNERVIYIKTGYEQNKKLVYISVRDTGYGIKHEEIERIFNPFYTTKPVAKGTGLGLSISKRILEDHGGRIEVVSNIGKGSTFTLLLPEVKGGATND